MDLCIDAIDKLHKSESSWIKQEMSKFAVAFTLTRLENEDLLGDQLLKEMPTAHYLQCNKITWSEMFIKQPAVQKLMERFLTEMQRILSKEIHVNRT